MSFSKNSKKNFELRFVLYPSNKKGWYTAACLDLALIRDGKDAFKLYQQINKLALRYLESIVKNNLSEKLLNQKLPKKYIKKYNEELENNKTKEKWERIIGEMFKTLAWNKKIGEINGNGGKSLSLNG